MSLPDTSAEMKIKQKNFWNFAFENFPDFLQVLCIYKFVFRFWRLQLEGFYFVPWNSTSFELSSNIKGTTENV